MTTFTRSVLKALLAAVAAATVLIFIFAFVAYRTDDPARLTGILGMAAFIFSCFAGGAMSRRGNGSILNSIAFAGVFILLCFSLSLVFSNKQGIAGMLVTYLGGVAAAILSGILFKGSKQKKPKRLKSYKKQKSIKLK